MKLGAAFAIVCLFFIWLACLAAQSANATIGIAHGIGPHLPSPTTISVGRVYYNPGDGHMSMNWQIADHGLAMALKATESHPLARARRDRCAVLHVEYVSRHGIATPDPLKGFSGCQKWAMDSAYWRHRRGESPNVPSSPGAQIGFQIGLALRQPAQIIALGWL
jgi:hypothetical protein